ncbi:MAG: recombinase family protein [Paracoccaceae bacterium]
MTTILYARVSTTDQNAAHQFDQATAAGFQIDEVITDVGVSGVSTTLRERPEGSRLFDKLRRGDTLVVRWVDRLGRNYKDVTETIRHFMNEGVIIKTAINGMVFDGATSDPMQKAVRDAVVAFMAATAEAQAEATKEAQKAGIQFQRVQDPTKYRGKKPTYDREKLLRVSELISEGHGTTAVSKELGLSRQTVIRIRANPEAAEAALARWGL